MLKVNKAYKIIDQPNQVERKLEEAYTILEKKDKKLREEWERLEKKFFGFGRLLFRKRINSIIQQWPICSISPIDIPSSNDLKECSKQRFKTECKTLLERLSYVLVDQYTELLRQKWKRLDSTILESLVDKYLMEYLKSDLRRRYPNNPKVEEIVKDSELMNKIWDLFKELLLNPSLFENEIGYKKVKEEFSRPKLQKIIGDWLPWNWFRHLKSELNLKKLYEEFNYLKEFTVVGEKLNLLSKIKPPTIKFDYQPEDIKALFLKDINKRDLEKWKVFKEDENIQKICGKKTLDLMNRLYLFPTLVEDYFRLASEIDKGNLDLSSLTSAPEWAEKLKQRGIVPTGYLVYKLLSSQNKEETIREWLSIIDSFARGNFDQSSELHRNLEYTRFRAIVDHEKVRRHLKNSFTFADYLRIFEKEKGLEARLTKQDEFEIECLVEEAKVFRDYVLSIKQRAKQLGKECWVIPNFSYGYLPVSPLIDEFEQEGIKVILGVKVGSTECHDNKEVINSRLLKGYRTEIINKQPIILVVDGTTHLIARDNDDRSARYPDAYQGYLNQVIALNDALGFIKVDYSGFGKSKRDLTSLRQNSEFQRLVGIYKEIEEKTDKRKKKPYQFGLWNTAGMNLIIRNQRKKIRQIAPMSPEEIQGPAMIFCNIGLLDDQIPQELKYKYKGLIHTPAYFDDSEKIIDFDFGYDRFGIKYLNALENKVKEAYIKKYGNKCDKVLSIDHMSSLVKYIRRESKRLKVPEPVKL